MISRILHRVRSKRAGFTLIETLMAILILSTAIAGPMTIASRGLHAALASKNKTTAFYLAQDAMEYIRYKRDSNRLSGAAWLSGLSSCISADGSTSCTINSFDTLDANACIGSCAPINYDSTNSKYLYSNGGSNRASNFTRSVYITCAGGSACSSAEAQIKIVVSWVDIGSATAKPFVTIQEDLLNWQ